RYVATAMAYDDVIRVADLKTRGTRFDRVRQEVGARPDQLVYTTEFMHPRLEEICGTLPAGLGRWLEGSKAFGGFVARRLGRGRPRAGRRTRQSAPPGPGVGRHARARGGEVRPVDRRGGTTGRPAGRRRGVARVARDRPGQ